MEELMLYILNITRSGIEITVSHSSIYDNYTFEIRKGRFYINFQVSPEFIVEHPEFVKIKLEEGCKKANGS